MVNFKFLLRATTQSPEPLSVIFEERYQIEDFANLNIYWPLPFWFLNFMPNNFCVKIWKIKLNILLKIILLIFGNCAEYHTENYSVLTVLIFKILGWEFLNLCAWKIEVTWRKLSVGISLEIRFLSLCRPWFSTSRTEFNPVKFALELKILRTTDGFVKCGGQALALKFLRNYSQKAIFFYKFLYFSKRKMAFCLV